MTTVNTEVYELLYPTAQGDAGREAAVELLHAHERWLRVLDHHGWITYGPDDQDAEDAAEGGYEVDPYAYINWTDVAAALDGGDGVGIASEAVMALRVGSGSERAVLALACSLAAGTGVDVRELSRLDRHNRQLALRAIAHSMGGRAYAEQVFPPGRRV